MLIKTLLPTTIAREYDSEKKEDEPTGYDSSKLLSRLNRRKEGHIEQAVEANDTF